MAVAPELVAPEPATPVEGQVQAPSKPIPEVGAHTPPQRSVDPPAPQEIASGNPTGGGTPAPAGVAPPAVNEVAPVNLPAGGTRRAH